MPEGYHLLKGHDGLFRWMESATGRTGDAQSDKWTARQLAALDATGRAARLQAAIKSADAVSRRDEAMRKMAHREAEMKVEKRDYTRAVAWGVIFIALALFWTYYLATVL